MYMYYDESLPQVLYMYYNGSLPHVWCDLHVHVYTGGHTNHKVLDAGTVEPL